MKNYRLGMLAAAIAAVSLVGCDDSSGPGTIKITTANAPLVGGDGAALMAGAMDVDDEAGPDAVLPGGVTTTGGTTGGKKPQGLSFIKLGELVRASVEAGELAELLSPELPTGAAVTVGTTVDCETSGSYIYYSNSTSWGITFNKCVSEYSESGEGSSYESRYTINGTATGQWDSTGGYGGWEADYEGLRSTYKTTYSNPEGSGSYSGEYQTDGHFEYFYDYGGYGGSYAQNYVATDLKVKYKYNATGDAIEGDDYKGSGTITYDTYAFKFYNYSGIWYWQGNLYATDSERGIWSITTPQPFGTDYCNQHVFGSIRISGRIYEEEGSANKGSNVLVMTGNGDNLVTYDLYEPDGTTLISSNDHDWFAYYDGYYCY